MAGPETNGMLYLPTEIAPGPAEELGLEAFFMAYAAGENLAGSLRNGEGEFGAVAAGLAAGGMNARDLVYYVGEAVFGYVANETSSLAIRVMAQGKISRIKLVSISLGSKIAIGGLGLAIAPVEFRPDIFMVLIGAAANDVFPVEMIGALFRKPPK